MAEFAPPRSAVPQLRCLADCDVRPTAWLMLDRIPYGHITVLGGKPGEGKSTLTMALAAEVTRKRMGVVFVGSEDDPASGIRPRLLAAGGDDSRFHMLGGDEVDPVFPEDADILEQAVRDTGAALVIIDPVTAHLSPLLNVNNDHSLRQAMRPIARIAQRTQAAVVVVMHRRKSTEGSPLDWLAGGAGFGGIARSALMFGTTRADAQTLDEDDRRYLFHVKGNLSRLRAPLSCRLQSAVVEVGGRAVNTSRLTFGAEDEQARPEDLR